MTSSDEPMQFERAEYTQPKATGLRCDLCAGDIRAPYWTLGPQSACAGCRAVVEASAEDARGTKNLLRATARAGLVALACGAGYALFVAVTETELALITIGIGWVVGRSVHKSTRGFGTRRHQVLAVALTYFASSMGYAVPITRGLLARPAATAPATGQAAPASGSPRAPEPAPAPPPASPAASPAASPTSPAPPMSVGRTLGYLVLFAGVVVATSLFAPFIMLFSGQASALLSLLILAFGMNAARRNARGAVLSWAGPHDPPATPPTDRP